MRWGRSLRKWLFYLSKTRCGRMFFEWSNSLFGNRSLVDFQTVNERKRKYRKHKIRFYLHKDSRAAEISFYLHKEFSRISSVQWGRCDEKYQNWNSHLNNFIKEKWSCFAVFFLPFLKEFLEATGPESKQPARQASSQRAIKRDPGSDHEDQVR